MAAGVAHEIKNAMVAVRTFVEMLLEQNKDAELGEIVKRELIRIDSLTAQMLRLGVKPEFCPAEVQLNDILERSLRLIEPQLRPRKIRLKRTLRASFDLIRGDRDQLEQAFTNLFLNAIEAVGQGGEISIATSIVQVAGKGTPKQSRSRSFQVTISDTGIGLSKRDLAQIFDPFFTTKPNGTGLGLPITREIIEQHRGTISVESEPRQGTTFRILFPLASATKARKPRTA
jgi:signal transduction histidine kinase